MKKIFALLLAAALLTVSLTACSSDGSADATPTPTQPPATENVDATPAPTEDGGETETTPAPDRGPAPEVTEGSKYTFVYQGAKLPMNQEASALLEWLGEPESYFEAASCAFEGLDKTYTYADFELVTYPNGDQDFISDIYITAPGVTTPEGIGVGSTQAEMEAAYGTDYTENLGRYTYTDGDTQLCFFIVDGAVSYVEYIAITGLLG